MSIDRRTLIKGAAWTAPVVALSLATPLAAASGGAASNFYAEWNGFSAGGGGTSGGLYINSLALNIAPLSYWPTPTQGVANLSGQVRIKNSADQVVGPTLSFSGTVSQNDGHYEWNPPEPVATLEAGTYTLTATLTSITDSTGAAITDIRFFFIDTSTT